MTDYYWNDLTYAKNPLLSRAKDFFLRKEISLLSTFKEMKKESQSLIIVCESWLASGEWEGKHLSIIKAMKPSPVTLQAVPKLSMAM